ncbi:bifunctional 2-polyprenyl-6-hydroxyphenol methylase/3-demethylubiquinol 3-O-methyltransferase UbiG [Sphingomonas sp. CJ99]
MAKASTVQPSSIDPKEASHFGRLAADWWNPRGESAMLHRLNPVRLAYVRESIDAHWPGAAGGYTPLAGMRALDVGCGAGLLAEPLARMGAAVTGLDAAPENIGAAQAHAAAMGLSIDYRAVGVETLDDEQFDLVTAMEVIEHVTDPAAFASALARVLAPGGLLIVSTPNRTPQSRIGMVGVAEALGMIPRGTHDWAKFLTPAELTDLLAATGLIVSEPRGIAWSPGRGLHLSDDLALNYLLVAHWPQGQVATAPGL